MALYSFFLSSKILVGKKKKRINAGVSSNSWTDHLYFKTKYVNICPEGNLKQYLGFIYFFCHSFTGVLAVS